MKTIASSSDIKCAGGVKLFKTWLNLAAVAACFLPLAYAQAADILWQGTNSGNNLTWNSTGSWVGGVIPTSSDNVVVNRTNDGFNINVDVATNISDLTFTRSAVAGLSSSADETVGVTNLISSQLSVLGPNGFLVQHSPAFKANSAYFFTGGSLLVSNTGGTSRFVLNSGISGTQTANKPTTVNMSKLTNLTVVVTYFGAANPRLAQGGGAFYGGGSFGGQAMKVTLARTNTITALCSNDYSGLDFTNSIEIGRQDYTDGTAASFAQNSFYQLGFSNAFFADSIGIGRWDPLESTCRHASLSIL